MAWLDINHIVFEIWGYPVSYIELIGTVFGLISVFLAAKTNILTWPTGILNEAAFFIIFFQVQLYSDMLLQVFFFAVTLYGWYFWKKEEEEKKVRSLAPKMWTPYLLALVGGTILLGFFMQNIHTIFPNYFPEKAAYPFADAFTTTASILATILLSRKLIQTWYFWITVDAIAVGLYFMKDIKLIAIEYIIFLIICIFGLIKWRKLV